MGNFLRMNLRNVKKKLYILPKIYIIWGLSEGKHSLDDIFWAYMTLNILFLFDLVTTTCLLCLSILGNSFSCFQSFLLATTYVATNINQLSKLVTLSVELIFVQDFIVYCQEQTDIPCWPDCSNWYSCPLPFNILFLARGTWRNSHLYRRFGNPGSNMLSDWNWDVAAAFTWSRADSADSSSAK